MSRRSYALEWVEFDGMGLAGVVCDLELGKAQLQGLEGSFYFVSILLREARIPAGVA